MTGYTARRLPKQTGPAGWNAILPEQSPLPVLEDDITADVVVIGGGFAGLSAARRLHQLDPRLRVAVVEAGRFADSSAGRNSGFMIDLPHDLASDNYAGDGVEADKRAIALNRRAIGFAKEVAVECDLPSEILDACGKYNAAATPAGDQHNRDYVAHLERLGEACTFLDQAQINEVTGSPHYTSGVYCPGTVMLQPAGYIRALSQHMVARIDVYENTPATAISRQGNGWCVATPKGRIATGSVVLANNGHLESFGFYRRRLMHICLYASITERLTDAQVAVLGGQETWGVTPADPMGTSVRKVAGSCGHRILIRTGATFNAKIESREAFLRAAGRTHDAKFRERFPQLPDVKMEHRWGGMLCLSRNGSSAFGELDQGIYAACCQNGLGTARGTLQGMGIAELLVRGQSEIADHFMREPEMPKLPPEPFASIGANAYLKWKEFRSGRE